MTRYFRHASAIAALLLLAFAVPALTNAQQPVAEPDEWIYTVQPGDTLWTLARTYLLGVDYWRRVQSLNRIGDPRGLPPGKSLRVPIAWLKAKPAPARVVAASGQNEIERAGGERGPVTIGALLNAGDTVTTAAGGSLTVQFADGSRLLLGASARLRFDVISVYGDTGMTDTSLRLERGHTESTVTPRRGRFRIFTPAASTVVRGTRFRADFEEADATARAEVTEGVIDATASTVTVAVPSGYGTTARSGEPPAPPTALLPAPDLGGLPKVVRQVPLRLQLPAVAGAAAYRVQMAPDSKIETLLFDEVVRTTELKGPDRPDGTYVVRVRAIDAHGLAGFDAEAPLTVDARPLPPVLIDPPQGATVRNITPTLRWSAPEGAAGYRIEVAAGTTFDAPVVAETIRAGASFTLAGGLQPGVYSWRVATVDASGEQGPFGDGQSFTRRVPPLNPDLGRAEVGAKTIVFRWTAGTAGQRYQFQLARDREFTDLVADRRVDEPQVSMDAPPAGQYYLRVRAIDTDGYEGAYGPAQASEVPAPPRRKMPWPLPLLGVAGAALLALLL